MDQVRASADRTWASMSDRAKDASMHSPRMAMRPCLGPKAMAEAMLAAKAKARAAEAMPKGAGKGLDSDNE